MTKWIGIDLKQPDKSRRIDIKHAGLIFRNYYFEAPQTWRPEIINRDTMFEGKCLIESDIIMWRYAD